MSESWRESAACRGLGPDWFYGAVVYDDDGEEVDESNHGIEGKGVCVMCDVQVECFDYAVRNRERYGIWGSVGRDRRQRLIAFHRSGDLLRYRRALAQEVENTARTFGLIPDDREPTAEAACRRCGDPIAEGVHPEDRNGDRATCGLPSTFNRGCRCARCVVGKANYYLESKGKAKPPKRKKK